MEVSDPDFDSLRTQAQIVFGLTDERTAQIVRIHTGSRQNWRIEFSDGNYMLLMTTAATPSGLSVIPPTGI